MSKKTGSRKAESVDDWPRGRNPSLPTPNVKTATQDILAKLHSVASHSLSNSEGLQHGSGDLQRFNDLWPGGSVACDSCSY